MIQRCKGAISLNCFNDVTGLKFGPKFFSYFLNEIITSSKSTFAHSEIKLWINSEEFVLDPTSTEYFINTIYKGNVTNLINDLTREDSRITKENSIVLVIRIIDMGKKIQIVPPSYFLKLASEFKHIEEFLYGNENFSLILLNIFYRIIIITQIFYQLF